MRQWLAARHVTEFRLRREVRFEGLENLGQFRRGRFGATRPWPTSQRCRARHAQADEMPSRQLLVLEKEAFRIFHGAGCRSAPSNGLNGSPRSTGRHSPAGPEEKARAERGVR